MCVDDESLTSLAIMGLLGGSSVRITGGSLRFDGRDLLGMRPRKRRALMGGAMAMVFQEPMTSLDPVYRVGDQIVEAIRQHRHCFRTRGARAGAGAARARAHSRPRGQARLLPPPALRRHAPEGHDRDSARLGPRVADRRRAHHRAGRHGASFTIRRGEVLALVGESGCGKSTVGRSLTKLERATGGQALFDGTDILPLSARAFRPLRRRLQMIFQDPFASLNPRLTIERTLAEPLAIHGLATNRKEARERIGAMLEQVGLGPEAMHRYPHEFSGGQRQRIGIARVMVLAPDLIVADEAVSALDVSVQAQVLNLLKALQRDSGVAMLFPDMGTKLLVITDNGRSEGDALARRLGMELYGLRGTTRPEFLAPDIAIERALAAIAAGADGPVVLADVWDNPGGGVPGDSTILLRALRAHGVRNAALATMWDPIATRLCFSAGVGATLPLRFGGKVSATGGAPIDASVTVRSLVRGATTSFGTSVVSLGDAARIELDGIDVILNTARTQVYDPDAFSNLGVDPMSRDLLVVKSTNHFNAAFLPIASRILYVAVAGPYPSDPATNDYRRVDRPLWPRDADPHDEPRRAGT